MTHLHTWFAQRDAQAVSVLAVMLDQLLKSPEGGSAGDEESSLIQLSDAVVFHCIAVTNCGRQVLLIRI